MITRAQLLELSFTVAAVRHRLARGRLRRIYPGVYAVGQLELAREGKWMAAVLACGQSAALSHESAAMLWGLVQVPNEPIHVSVLEESRSHADIEVHRRQGLDIVRHRRIPTTSVSQTLVDLGRHPQIEQLIGEAILCRRISAKALRTAAAAAGRPGAPLRSLIERATFRVTQSELEREFLRLVERAGLPLPETQTRFGRWRVDFFWPALGLVVETDGGRFHATPLQLSPRTVVAIKRTSERIGHRFA